MNILMIQDYAEGIITQAQSNPSLFAAILIILLEIFLRLKPTKRNLSIINGLEKLLSVINFVIPNNLKNKQ